MAELVFNLDDMSLTSSWVAITQELTGETLPYPYSKNLTSSTNTRIVTISGIPDGEVVKRAMLTASLNRVGTTDYSERITVNGLGFSAGSRKMDATEFINNTEWVAEFYFCGSGNAGLENASNLEQLSCTLYLSNIKLTITTGTGSAFDGEVSSLPDGSKFLIDEPDGGQGTYTLVQHDYNTGMALLWRDDVYVAKMFNSTSAKFADGNLDAYLNSEFYTALPDTTKNFIVAANYPTLSNHFAYGGNVVDLERYVCTPSVRELFDGAGAAEGLVFDYLDTVCASSSVAYWTRSMKSDTSVTQANYVYGNGMGYGSKDTNTTSMVRPCFCVSETQLVTQNGDYYTLTNKHAAPSALYLDGVATNVDNAQVGFTATLSWDAVSADNVRGYAVWRCTTSDGTYEYLNEVNAEEDGTIPTSIIVDSPDDGFVTYYYKVQTLGPTEIDYCDSDLSSEYRSIASKRTNMKYYDGYRWLLAAVKHYNGSTWDVIEGAKYYDGTQWVVPSSK